MPVEIQIEAALREIARSQSVPMHEAGQVRARRAYRRIAEHSWQNMPRTDLVVEDWSISFHGCDLGVRVYKPRSDEAMATLVYFHGGGWVIGDLDTHDSTARYLSQELNAVVVSVDYRLAPEHPFPAAFDDALASVRWSWQERADLGGSEILWLAGDSAGAGLAATVATAMRDSGHQVITAQFLLCPLLDLAPRTRSRIELGKRYLLEEATLDWFSSLYAGNVSIADLMKDVRACPSATASLVGMPPTFVVVAEFDPLRDEGIQYARALINDGVRVGYVDLPGMIHGFPDFIPVSNGAALALQQIVQQFDLFARGIA